MRRVLGLVQQSRHALAQARRRLAPCACNCRFWLDEWLQYGLCSARVPPGVTRANGCRRQPLLAAGGAQQMRVASGLGPIPIQAQFQNASLKAQRCASSVSASVPSTSNISACELHVNTRLARKSSPSMVIRSSRSAVGPFARTGDWPGADAPDRGHCGWSGRWRSAAVSCAAECTRARRLGRGAQAVLHGSSMRCAISSSSSGHSPGKSR
jgi:hypothetical protein